MLKSIEQLPVLGVGASLSLSSIPDPASLAATKGGPDFVEYAGLVDVDSVIDEIEKIKLTGAPVLYHPSHINFCGSFSNSKTWLEATIQHIKAVDSAWFAQDCAYCFWEEGPSYSTQLGYFLPPILNQASLDLAIKRVREVQQLIPVTVAIEPPPMTFVMGDMPLFQFFGELSRQTDTAILLDMGHLVSYEMASGRLVRDALDELPLDRVIEVHIAGGRLKQGEDRPIYVDAHETAILDETWKMFEDLLPELPNVKAVCFECEGVDEATVMSTLKRVRQLTKDLCINKTLLTKLAAQA